MTQVVKAFQFRSFSMSGNMLKTIAILAMFFDHVVAVFVPHETVLGTVLRVVGRIAAPTMCYFIAEGYFYTSDKKRYLKRLLILAVVSHVPYMLTFDYTFFQATSIIWGFVMGLIALDVVKNEKFNYFVKAILVLLCCAAAYQANWNFVSVLWIVGFGVFQGNFKKQMIAFSVIGFIFHIIPNAIRFGWNHEPHPHYYQLGIYLAIVFLAFYNGQRGKNSAVTSKFFYIFYPAHLLLIAFVARYSSLQANFG